MQLTHNQSAAVLSLKKNIAVVACPGSGKTTVLTRRILRLISEGVSPLSIYALTFTNKAAEELRKRLEEASKEGYKVSTTTFHGFALQIIRDFGSWTGILGNLTIYNEQDRHDIISNILRETGTKLSKKAIDEGIKEWLDTEKLDRVSRFAPILTEYLYRLKSYNGMDFDTMMIHAAGLVDKHPKIASFYREKYTYFLVDEAQDTDDIQHRLLASIGPKNLFWVGDIDQCIYEWRSARPDNMIGMLRNFKYDVVHLDKSHRCTQQTAKVANDVIRHNKNRYEKDIKTDKQGLSVQWLGFPGGWEEAEFVWDCVEGWVDKGIPAKEIFVMARTNRQISLLSRSYHEKEERPMKVEDLSRHTGMWKSNSVRSVVNSLKVLVNPHNTYILKNSVWAINKFQEVNKLATNAIFSGTSLVSGMSDSEPHMKEFLTENNLTGDAFSAVKKLVEFANEQLLTMGLDRQRDFAWRLVDYLFNWRANRVESVSIQTFLDWYNLKSLQDTMDLEKDTVKLMTVHAAKGLEASHVIIAGVNKDVFPSRRSNIEEERRLFYVAVTRAKERLVVTYNDKPSEFIQTNVIK